MTSLTVVSTPNESLAMTNKLFVAPDSMSEPYVMLGNALFSVQSDSRINPDQIALNSLQRRPLY